MTKKTTKKATKKTTKVAKTSAAKKPEVKEAVVVKPKKETCACGSECKCGPDCRCGQSCNCAFGIFIAIVVAVVACIAAIMYCPKDKAGAGVNKAEVRKEIAAYIKENPQAILDSVNTYLEKQQAEQEAANAPNPDDIKDIVASITKDKTNHVLGNPKGKFVVIEFFDYNCGFCKRMNAALSEAIKKSNNIRWILIDAPIFGEPSERIAHYAHAAAKQGKFAEFHAELASLQSSDASALEEIGTKLGLDIEKLKKDAESKEAKDKIQKNHEYVSRLKLSGVPMFIIDGELQRGAFDDAQMNSYIEKANAKK